MTRPLLKTFQKGEIKKIGAYWWKSWTGFSSAYCSFMELHERKKRGKRSVIRHCTKMLFKAQALVTPSYPPCCIAWWQAVCISSLGNASIAIREATLLKWHLTTQLHGVGEMRNFQGVIYSAQILWRIRKRLAPQGNKPMERAKKLPEYTAHQPHRHKVLPMWGLAMLALYSLGYRPLLEAFLVGEIQGSVM